MANVDIREFSNIGYVGLGLVPVADARVGATIIDQSIAIGGSSVASNAFNAKTNLIRVQAEAICAVSVGGTAGFLAAGAVTAVAPNGRMVAGQTEYFVVSPGDKLAVITST